MQCHSLVSNYKPGSSPMGDIFFAVALAQACSLIVYLLTLLPGNVRELDDEEFQYERLTQDPLYLGVAKADSNFFSKFVFFWVNPLIRKGRMGLLQSPDDVFEVPIEMDTSSLSQKFHSNMERLSDSNRAGKTVILRVLFNCFGRQFFAIGVLKFMADCSGFAGPLLLNELLTFMESQEKDMMWGYIYASGLAASTFVTAMCNTHFTLFMAELGLKVRAAVTTAVYRHTLKMTSSQMGGFGVGEIINFMSTDTDRIVNFSPTLHSTWSLPLQFSVTMILLYKQVGLSCLVGVAITIIMIPLNKHIVDMIFKMSTNLMAAKDERVKIMSEVLHGVRSIKFFAWEDYFLGRVNKTRNEELKYLKGRKYLDAICTYLWATTPVLISVLTFVSYALLGNVLTAAKVFTSVALFAMLTGPLNAFPWVLNGLIEAMVSIRRVSAYLTEQEIARESYFSSMAEVADMERADATDIAIGRGQFLVQNGNESATSADDGGNRFILSDITLNVEKGDFIGVIGRVGSGKSTLLSAILGELKRESGGIAVTEHSGGVGYVSQEPWLQQGTIRDNILFGKEYDQDWYQKVTDACTLGEDFQHLCNGDATNVGEQGSMLSGGQKARVR
jgi:ATP-binding cassette subfamily C (CFTR/MRP) protein 10